MAAGQQVFIKNWCEDFHTYCLLSWWVTQLNFCTVAVPKLGSVVVGWGPAIACTDGWVYVEYPNLCHCRKYAVQSDFSVHDKCCLLTYRCTCSPVKSSSCVMHTCSLWWAQLGSPSLKHQWLLQEFGVQWTEGWMVGRSKKPCWWSRCICYAANML